jgi:hypothetical protein
MYYIVDCRQSVYDEGNRVDFSTGFLRAHVGSQDGARPVLDEIDFGSVDRPKLWNDARKFPSSICLDIETCYRLESKLRVPEREMKALESSTGFEPAYCASPSSSEGFSRKSGFKSPMAAK